jgi:putative inorganic carbon (hco3(-)) transporter
MRDLALGLVIFGLLPFVLKRPFWGILMSAWLGYMNPHLLCYGFMRSMPVVQIVVIFTFVGMLASKEAKRMVWSREMVVLVVFIIWMGITTTQAINGGAAFQQYIKVIKIQVLTFMALLLLTSRDRIHVFVWVIVLSLGFYGVKGGLFTIANGGAFRVQGPGGFIGGNNEMALALVMTIPLMRYLHLQETHKLVKTGLAIAMLLTAVAAIGSQSRGALVAMTLMGTIFWFKSRHKLATGILIVIAIGVLAAVMPESWYARMNTIETYNEDASALGRLNAWYAAFNLANGRFLGGGFETWTWQMFQQYAPDPNNARDVHSIYFEVLGEHGWIGLTLYLTLLAMTWRKCSALIRMARKQPELRWAGDLGAMLQVSMVGYLSAGAFLGLAYFDYIYHLVTIAVVTHHLVAPPLSAGAASSVPAHQPPVSIRRALGLS